jgi:isopentenyl-diphosphate delta-isomerase
VIAADVHDAYWLTHCRKGQFGPDRMDRLTPGPRSLGKATLIQEVSVMKTDGHVVLVDDRDREIGTGEKLEVHRQGALHRAFSVIIWDRAGRLLLQKRHPNKYHSGGLWTNACCGHPQRGEDITVAARRRLEEEMGFFCQIEALGTIYYRAELDQGMIEHEIVHVFRGVYDGAVTPNPEEAEDHRWSSLQDVQADASATSQSYSVWFRKYLKAQWPVALALPRKSG